MLKIKKPKLYRYNKKGLKVRKNPKKVAIGKKSSLKLKNRKRSLLSRRKESVSIRKELRTGRIKSGRRTIKRRTLRIKTPYRSSNKRK